jgi:hypothetical protein
MCKNILILTGNIIEQCLHKKSLRFNAHGCLSAFLFENNAKLPKTKYNFVNPDFQLIFNLPRTHRDQFQSPLKALIAIQKLGVISLKLPIVT